MAAGAARTGLTRRDLLKKGALVGGTVLWVTPVVQTVGMSRALAQDPSDTCEEQWAASVVSATQGPTKGGGSVATARSNPASALGPPSAPAPSGDEAFYSLGFRGQLTLMFGQPAYIATGSDVVVVETTNGRASYPLERAAVEVSQDGSTFYSIGTATNKPNAESFLDLSGLSVTYIQYVRLTDTTDESLFSDANADGFDVNAVGIACNAA